MKTKTLSFPGFVLQVKEGWQDITDSVDAEDPPFTIAAAAFAAQACPAVGYDASPNRAEGAATCCLLQPRGISAGVDRTLRPSRTVMPR
jgi:hypothetical protein